VCEILQVGNESEKIMHVERDQKTQKEWARTRGDSIKLQNERENSKNKTMVTHKYDEGMKL
jgi:hypothetical protein